MLYFISTQCSPFIGYNLRWSGYAIEYIPIRSLWFPSCHTNIVDDIAIRHFVQLPHLDQENAAVYQPREIPFRFQGGGNIFVHSITISMYSG